MIKTAKIKNVFGIKEFNVDFQISHIRGEKDLNDQIIVNNDEKIALVPTFLAKNGKGKTSFAKAIAFALRFLNKRSFMKEVVHYKMNEFFKIMELTYLEEEGESEEENKVFTQNVFNNDFAEKTISNLFKEIVFAGEKLLEIELTFLNEKNILIEMSKRDFFITTNNAKINVKKFLQDIDILSIMSNQEIQSAHVTKFEIKKKVREQINKFDFFLENGNIEIMIRENIRSSSIKDFEIKHHVGKYINNLINNFGIETTKMLLHKIDNKIKNVLFDPVTKSFSINLDGLGDISIVPSVLSYGTQKTIEIISKSINLFKNGGVFIIDEIENGLHLSLIKLIVSMYEDEEINKAKAQIIFTTHNPLIIEQGIVNIDNVFMTEKDNFISLNQLQDFGNKKNRTENKMQFVKSKNYYNDLFWFKNNIEQKSTLSDLAINQIINKIAESPKWHKK